MGHVGEFVGVVALKVAVLLLPNSLDRLLGEQPAGGHQDTDHNPQHHDPFPHVLHGVGLLLPVLLIPQALGGLSLCLFLLGEVAHTSIISVSGLGLELLRVLIPSVLTDSLIGVHLFITGFLT